MSLSFSENISHFSDQELISAMNSGDEAAFEVLYHRHRDWVATLARKFTGCDSLANDVLQETFLYPAVKNHSLNVIGKVAKFQAGIKGQNVLERLVAPTSAPCSTDDFDAVLAGLSEDHREVLMLRFVDELSLDEIAEATRIPLGTAKSRLHHALSRLREDPKTREYFLS